MVGITLNPVTLNRFNYSKTQATNNSIDNQENKYTASGATILANQNIAFMSKRAIETDENGIPKYDTSLVADEAEGHYSYYLRNNPEEFFIKNGVEINNFLRKGELKPILEREEDVEPIYREMIAEDVRKVKDYNKAIIDSVEILDEIMIDRTKEPMVVYRYAPISWLDTAENGIVKDAGFFSTTTEKGGAIKDYDNMEDVACFEVWIPENTPYVDLTDKAECEMLFPRGLEFSVLDNKNLEMLSKE